ncbi:MAG: hypothetical protein FWG06_03140, partial [Clostridiales bacterium]|nr:hypothetical protein [Clostridiales bacterium]
WDGRFSRENILLTACLVCVLALAAAVLRQTEEIKRNNKAYSLQNLIINGHSHVALGEMQIRFDDGEQMFLSINKLEFVLQAKGIQALYQPQSQALLQISLALKLGSDIPVTEYYIKRLSLFAADTVIECENPQKKFYPLYAVNGTFALNFYTCCKDVAAEKLTGKFFAAAGLRLYYSFVIKNSAGVITELYGTALYEKASYDRGNLHYTLQETKDNQYYYM